MKKKSRVLEAGIIFLAAVMGIVNAYFQQGEARFGENLERFNVLILGVDKEEKMWEEDDDGGSLGQADAIFVASLELKSEQMDLIFIPRDTMVNIEMYNVNGEYRGSCEAQICLQYAYGDGQSFSCELMRKQVEELLGIPIRGYAAINLSALPIFNDLVGGVDITMDEDYRFIDPSFSKGAVLHLDGEKAMDYLQGRDIEEAGSAYFRLNRHKQYLQSFYQQAKKQVEEKPSIVFDLVKILLDSDYLETDLKLNEIVYLAGKLKSESIDENQIWILEGNIVQGRIYEEYYVDQEKLEELVRQLYHRF